MLLPTNWYKKHGEHNFTTSSKTPDLGVRERAAVPLASTAAATSTMTTTTTTAVDLNFEQFGEAWYELSKQYSAGDSKVSEIEVGDDLLYMVA